MKHKPKETSRQAYIRILSDPVREPSQDDLSLTCELIEADLLDGTLVRDEKGGFVTANVFGSRVSGRLFLEKLTREEVESTLLSKSLRIVSSFWGFIAGVLSSLIVMYIENKAKNP